MSDVALEDLPFNELRERAFKRAEHHLDIGFFTDLFGHMPGMVAIEGEGGDLGPRRAQKLVRLDHGAGARPAF